MCVRMIATGKIQRNKQQHVSNSKYNAKLYSVYTSLNYLPLACKQDQEMAWWHLYESQVTVSDHQACQHYYTLY